MSGRRLICALAAVLLLAWAPCAAHAEEPLPPAQYGAWTQAPFKLPTLAINTVLLHSGKVLFWSFPPRDDAGVIVNEGRAALWDPALGTGSDSMTDVTPPVIDLDGDGIADAPAPLFCSGQSLLTDGRVLVVGGRLGPGPKGGKGLDTTFVFDPVTESWSREPDIHRGRYYPGQVLLPDGRTVILSGNDETGTETINPELEVYTPGAGGGAGDITQHPEADRVTHMYPHLFVVPTGRVLLAGPGADDSALLNVNPFQWSDIASKPVERTAGATAVLRPTGPAGSARVTEIGGMTPYGPYGSTPHASSETIDAAALIPMWTADAPLNIARSYANTVLLPDSTMVEIGGGDGLQDPDASWHLYPDGRARQVELFDPALNEWRLGPAQQEDRGYHSTAVLLPDGRVFSAGDERHPNDGTSEGWSDFDTAELYSPPYLFRGERPAISSAPVSLAWGDEFGIGVDGGGGPAVQAVLVAPGATTHAVDTNQRLVPLALTGSVPGKGINVVAPPSANVALPGWYMLFVLNADGVPSVARWVLLEEGASDAPLLAPDPAPAEPAPADSATPAPPGRRRAAPQPEVWAAFSRAALTRARRTGRLLVRVRVNEAAAVELAVRLRDMRGAKGFVVVGASKTLTFPAAGRRLLQLPLGRSVLRALRSGRGGVLAVHAHARDVRGATAARVAELRLASRR